MGLVKHGLVGEQMGSCKAALAYDSTAAAAFVSFSESPSPPPPPPLLVLSAAAATILTH